MPKETPYLVDSLTALPADWQSAVAAALPSAELPHTIVMIPRHTQTTQKRRRFVPAQALLFTAAGVLQVQAGMTPEQPPTALYLRGADLLVIRHSLILLYGCLELTGLVDDTPTRLVVEYNTVGLPLLLPAYQRLVQLAYGVPPARVSDTEPLTVPLLQSLDQQSFKFKNGLQFYALLPGEPLLGYVWQPRITRRVIGPLRRPIAPAALLALTLQAVILMTEERAKGAAYGWLITFCPRRRLIGLAIRPRPPWYVLSVALERATPAPPVLLESERAAAWEQLWASQGQSLGEG